MPTTAIRLPLNIRAHIIDYLVKQERPATPEQANELKVLWDECDDETLVQANNYNRTKNGLPAKQYS